VRPRFTPEKPQQRIALFRQPTEPLPPSAGIFPRDHPYITSQGLTVSKSCWISQEHVVANAVTGPTPGWVISSRAPVRLQACSSTRWFNFSISAPSFAYSACNSFRRYAVCGANGNEAILCWPAWLHREEPRRKPFAKAIRRFPAGRAFRYNFVIQECSMLKFGDLLFLIASQVSSQRC
jgi:hypothetical protein